MGQIQSVFKTTDGIIFAFEEEAQEHQDKVDFSNMLHGFLDGKCETNHIHVGDFSFQELCKNISKEDLEAFIKGSK